MSASVEEASLAFATRGEKATALALGLAHAENALRALTSGQVDAIIDANGQAYLLRPAQEQLRRNESRLEAILDSIADVILVVSGEGVVLSTNHAGWRIFGRGREELAGSALSELIHADDLADVQTALSKVLEGFIEIATVHFRRRDSDGSYPAIEATLARLRSVPLDSVVFSMRPVSPPRSVLPGTKAPFGQLTPAKELAEVFRNQHEEIIREWRLQAGLLFPSIDLDQFTISDRLPGVIAAVTRELALPEGAEFARPETPGADLGKASRLFHSALDVGSVVAKYNLLRTAFLTVADRHGAAIDAAAALIINRWIDEAVRAAVVAFAAQQAAKHAAQEEEHHSFIAHDLRTPLNAISLLVEELKFSLSGESRMIEEGIFASVFDNLRRVERLIERVLERREEIPGEGNWFRPKRCRFELRPLVDSVIDALRAISSRSGTTVFNEIPPQLGAFADPALLAEVFENLLTNAYRYTPGGRVVIRAFDEGSRIICFVHDDGEGIPPNLLPIVFEKRSTDPARKGSGLGLAIVRQIVEAHGGKVSVESTSGAGAVFIFSLPEAGEVGDGRALATEEASIFLADLRSQ